MTLTWKLRLKEVRAWNEDPVRCTLTFFFVERVNLKRVPVLPRGAHTVSVADNTPQTIVPVPYETTI
jgi:hypothetical protein